MAIKPILFNTEMVRAILDGRKTCTRRIVRPPYFVDGDENDKRSLITLRTATKNSSLYRQIGQMPYPDAPYRMCDILYVRETWYKGLERYIYRADYSDTEKFYRDGKEIEMKWHPSLHMPKEAARIWLRVTDVRVERLQEITGQDVLKEGLNSHVHPQASYFDGNQREMFEKLWNSTIKKSDLDRYGWDANPWVWVISFERCEKPEEKSLFAWNDAIHKLTQEENDG